MRDFCLVPWYSLEPGLRSFNDRACCLWPNSYDKSQIQQSFLQGESPQDCQRCWYNEQQGLISKRQQDNQHILASLNLTFDQAHQAILNAQARPQFYQLQLSNTCNQACATCNGSASSRWISLDPQNTSNVVIKDLNKIDINYAQAKTISFSGGEPLYDDLSYQCLQRLVDAGNTDCAIVFVTNGSQPVKGRYHSLLSKFTNISAVVSIDGTGAVFEYLRWPAKWSTLLTNIAEYRQQFKHVSVSYTISSLNIWDHEDTVQWFQDQRLNYNHNIVNLPQWANPTLLPVKLKDKIQPGSFAETFKAVNGREVSLDSLVSELHRQDSLKKINFRDYLPRLSVLIDS